MGRAVFGNEAAPATPSPDAPNSHARRFPFFAAFFDLRTVMLRWRTAALPFDLNSTREPKGDIGWLAKSLPRCRY